MNNSEWIPTTFEDKLLQEYLSDNPGKLFLEVRVGGSEDNLYARRIDGILIPDKESAVYPPGEYSNQDLLLQIDGNPIHIIEAKRTLNRNVIGQVIAGSSLLERKFQPSRISLIVLCATGETDLEWVCKQHDVIVALYPIQSKKSSNSSTQEKNSTFRREDIRKDPDESRRRAFLSEWTAAVNGQLYKAVRKQKTHANMGNLFGWIYGNQDIDFRTETWDRYVDNLIDLELLE